MVYEYKCRKCGENFDVIKPAAKSSKKEKCPHCSSKSDRVFSANIYFNGASVEKPEYSPALGCWTKDKYDRREKARRKGMVEVGNDFKSGDSMQKHYDTMRETKRKKSYEDI